MDLIKALHDSICKMYGFYFGAHLCHWNVTGINFPEMHKFFGDLYDQAFDSVDDIAEHVRTLDEPVELTLEDIADGNSVDVGKTPESMLAALNDLNLKLVESLTASYVQATKAKEVGLANFLQDLIDRRMKVHWQLNATGK